MNAPARTTALAVVQQMPHWLSDPIQTALTQFPDAELLLPSTPINAELGYGHKVAVSVVRISANPDEKEVFSVGKRRTGSGRDAVEVEVYAYSKAGIERLAESAGISLTTERTDDRKNRDYCEFRAFAMMKSSSGQPIIRPGTKGFDMRDVAEEAWRNRVSRRDYAKAKGWSNGNVSDEELQKQHDAEMSAFRKHLVRRTETGAMLAAIRSQLGIKSGLTKEQIERPKILARIEFNPDASDPVVQKFLLEQGSRAQLALYAPQRQHASAAVVEEEIPGGDDDDRAMLGGGRVEALAQEPLPLGKAPVENLGAGDEQLLHEQIEKGADILGWSEQQLTAHIRKHRGTKPSEIEDLQAAFAEINTLVNAKGGA